MANQQQATVLEQTKSEAGKPHRGVHLRRSLNFLIMSTVFGSIANVISTGLPLTQLAKFLNTSQFGFGVLGGLAQYGQFAQWLGSYLVERFGHHKRFVIFGGLLYRLLWLPVAFLPFFAHVDGIWIVLLLFAMLSYIVVNLINPAGAAWTAFVVPGQLQGRFFGRRNQFGIIISMACMFVVSYGIDKAISGGQTTLRNFLIILFVLVALVGAFEALMFVPIPTPEIKKHKDAVKFWSIIFKPLADREFVCFVGYYTMLSCSTVFMGQFFMLFLLDVLKMSNVKVIILLAIVPNVMHALVYPFWGRIADRLGYKPALLIGGLAYMLYACWLVMARPDNWVIWYVCAMLVNLFQCAMETGYTVFMYTRLSGRGTSDLGSAYSAVAGMIMALAGALTAIFSGIVAVWLGKDWHAAPLGHPMTYHSFIFCVAVTMRFLSLFWLMGVKSSHNYGVGEQIGILREQLIFDCSQVFRRLHYHLARNGKSNVTNGGK